MDAANKRRLWLWCGMAVLAVVCALLFSAYLNPNMVAVFGDVMAFCASLIR